MAYKHLLSQPYEAIIKIDRELCWNNEIYVHIMECMACLNMVFLLIKKIQDRLQLVHKTLNNVTLSPGNKYFVTTFVSVS